MGWVSLTATAWVMAKAWVMVSAMATLSASASVWGWALWSESVLASDVLRDSS